MLIGAILGAVLGFSLAWFRTRVEGPVAIVGTITVALLVILAGVRLDDSQVLGVGLLCYLVTDLITTGLLRRNRRAPSAQGQ